MLSTDFKYDIAHKVEHLAWKYFSKEVRNTAKLRGIEGILYRLYRKLWFWTFHPFRAIYYLLPSGRRETKREWDLTTKLTRQIND